MSKEQVASLAADIDRDLRAIRHILRRPLEAEVARGSLTGPQQNVMRVLVVSGGTTLKELSKQVGLAHSTVSGIIDRLEKRGMVKRQADESDLRCSRIVATDLVRNWVRDTLPNLAIHPLADALRTATPAERRAVLEGVRVLRSLLERRAPAPTAPAPAP